MSEIISVGVIIILEGFSTIIPLWDTGYDVNAKKIQTCTIERMRSDHSAAIKKEVLSVNKTIWNFDGLLIFYTIISSDRMCRVGTSLSSLS